MFGYLVRVYEKGALIAEITSDATEALAAIAYVQSELNLPTFNMRSPDGVIREYVEPQYHMEARRCPG